MTRIIHLTDLHFGQDRADLAAPLAQAVRALAPDLVIAGGDLTHRARAGQFARARAWLAGLGAPVLSVPGNHDMPLFNLPLRLAAPFRAFAAGAGPVRPAARAVGRAWVMAANTADPWVWRRGRLPARQRDALMAELAAAPPGLVPVLVAHHPFAEPEGFARGETRGAAQALPRLAEAGLQVLLTGHLHHWTVGLGIAPGQPVPVLQVQTGTALCARAGEQDHGFAVLDLAEGALTVTPWIVGADGRPEAREPRRFDRRGGRWHLAARAAPG
jgi:3',5'-cyclic AMP phosphodiesterase CpdA